MDEDSLKLLLAQGLSVEEIGRRYQRNASTVAYWMRNYGIEAPDRETYAAKGGIERERLAELVDEGRSIAEIAETLDRGKSTVRYWLRRHGLRTKAARRGGRERGPAETGLREVERECARHGLTGFAVEGRGYYRCKRCRSEHVAGRRRALKVTLVAEAGGRCCLCGYDRCVSALEFHHLDPATKRLGIAAGGLSHSLQTLRGEIAKCVLLCSNCHAEVESGTTALPIKSPAVGADISGVPGSTDAG
jgi:transposase